MARSSLAPSLKRMLNWHCKLLTVSFFLGFGLTACSSSGGDEVDEPIQAEDSSAAPDDAAMAQADADQAAPASETAETAEVPDEAEPVALADDGTPISDEAATADAPQDDAAQDMASAAPAAGDQATDTVNAELVDANNMSDTAPSAAEPASTESDMLADSIDAAPAMADAPVETSAPSVMPSSGSVSSPGAAKHIKGKHDKGHHHKNDATMASASTMSGSGSADGVYVIQAGDTLAGIAGKIYGSYKHWHSLAELNSLGAPYKIYPGHELRFDTSNPKAASFAKNYHNSMKTVTVERGDTLSKIAEKVYGDVHQWKALAALNKDKISNPNRIHIGMKLAYVDQGTTATATTESAAEAPQQEAQPEQAVQPEQAAQPQPPKAHIANKPVKSKMLPTSAKPKKSKKAPITAEDLGE